MRFCLAAMIVFALAGSLAIAVEISTVPVGNAGNLQDDTGFGAVAYNYRIGTTEVTNAQYTAFLNARAASDLAIRWLFTTPTWATALVPG